MRIFVIGLALAMFTGCEEDPYNASPIDPRLPELSANGENTAGAYVDGYAWIADLPHFPNEPMFTICTHPDSSGSLILISNGYLMREETLVRRDVGIYLGSIPIQNTDQLDALEGTEVTLDGTDNYGLLILENPTSDTLRFGAGKLFIRDVILKTEIDELIVSGTFGFDFKANGINHSVHSGRFDFRVDRYNFCSGF